MPQYSEVDEAWSGIKDSRSVAVLETFLKQFAGSRFEIAVKARIEEDRKNALDAGREPLRLWFSVKRWLELPPATGPMIFFADQSKVSTRSSTGGALTKGSRAIFARAACRARFGAS